MRNQHQLYDTVEEIQNRLVGTVVTYDGQPVYVSDARDGGGFDDGVHRIGIKAFPYNGAASRKRIDSPLFKRFVTPPLGFMNYYAEHITDAAFCERTPARRMRQGLSAEVFACSSLVGGWQWRFDGVYNSEAFREMVVGEYPSLDEVMGRLHPGSSIAVHRDYALRMDDAGYVNLYYRRDNIGVFVRGNLYLRNDRAHMLEGIVENAALPDRVEVL